MTQVIPTMTHTEINLCVKAGPEDGDVVRSCRVIESEFTGRVILIGVGDGFRKNEGKKDKDHGDHQLGEVGTNETKRVEEPLHEDGAELLEPENNASVGFWELGVGRGGGKERTKRERERERGHSIRSLCLMLIFHRIAVCKACNAVNYMYSP